MKSVLIFISMLLLSSTTFSQESCPNFTKKQEHLIASSYIKGYQDNLGYSLAAIVWKESFVGKYIVRVNNGEHNDSYGITHIELRTAMYLLGESNIWKAKDEIVMKLMSDDDFAMDMALAKLKTLKRFHWKKQVQKYNGVGTKYGEDITSKVKILTRCYNFQIPVVWE